MPRQAGVEASSLELLSARGVRLPFYFVSVEFLSDPSSTIWELPPFEL